MFLSLPNACLIKFFKTHLIEFYHNSQLMTDPTYVSHIFLSIFPETMGLYSPTILENVLSLTL